jgi:peroxiredoxin
MAFWSKRELAKAGSPAPDFQLERIGGGSVNLAKITADGPVLLAFFKISCPVCQLTLPFLERIHSPGNLAVYGVSQNGETDTREFARQYGLTFPMLLDLESGKYIASDAYGISTVPTLFLIERDGRISRAIEGWQKKEIEALGEKAGVVAIRDTDAVPALKAG